MKPTPVRRILWVIAILVALGLLMAGLAQAQPVQITDDRGRAVALPRSPQRIVSLLPSLTESVCELEQCHRLVGVDRYSNWPDAVVGKLPKVGGGLDPSIEAIVARVRERAGAEGGHADVMEAIYRTLMEACIAHEHREFARLRAPATAGSAA